MMGDFTNILSDRFYCIFGNECYLLEVKDWMESFMFELMALFTRSTAEQDVHPDYIEDK